ncbi:MAG TPA: hypothetical protein DCZ23_05330 [Lachnospiraceae bacterium]|nr:hypothetical protein [Lachnospiraceae bacterium]
MNCPRCNATVPFGKRQCNNCSQDLKDYWKVVSLSNIYYNKALGQAKIRDLTGAINSLKQSLQFNKLNTNARNLIGLIYFETGEIVSALSEWVISKHYQSDNNDADYYINQIQANPNKLETYSQTIRKYNTALDAAQHGDEDMAIIQLKKVVNTNPKFIRANQLLALLYMMSDKKDGRTKALKILNNIIKVDVTNTTTLRYLQELSDVHAKTDYFSARSDEKKENSRKNLPHMEDSDQYKTITPYKEERPSIMPLVNIIIGVIIGLAVMYCLIMPHIMSSEADDANKDFKKYSAGQAASDSSSIALKNQNETLQARIEQLEEELEEFQGDGTGTTILDEYDKLFKAVNAFMAEDMEKAAKNLIDISTDNFDSSSAKKIYNAIASTAFYDASEKLYVQGRDAYNGQNEYAGAVNYKKAKECLEKSIKYNPDNTDAIYFLGRTYQQTSKPKKAKKCYEKIINEYPDSPRVAEANTRLRELGISG